MVSDPSPSPITGLVERLRAYRPRNDWGDGVHHTICDEAADAIDALSAQPTIDREAIEHAAERVYAAMKLAADQSCTDDHPEWMPGGNSLMQDEARRTVHAVAALLHPIDDISEDKP